MDIALEIIDHYVADDIYAKLMPLTQAFHNSTVAYNGADLTTQQLPSWEYTPSTHLFYLEPTSAAYDSVWARDNIYRQFITLFFTGWIFAALNYFFFSTLSYIFIFDKDTFKHPKFLKNQIRLEIKSALQAMPMIAVLTALMFLTEVRGMTKLYDTTEEGPGRWYDWTQIFFFILFTDFLIYWIHRGLHHPLIYRHLHKAHHKWIMPTPYASYAFHPLDGFSQSFPYHAYPFFFPMHKLTFIGAFMFVNLWTVMIHDGEYVTDNPIINGSACHGAHHLWFNYNYGQFFTLWDRIGGSYRRPDPEWFNKATKKSKETWQNGIDEMEKIQQAVEGDDDRSYSASTKKDI